MAKKKTAKKSTAKKSAAKKSTAKKSAAKQAAPQEMLLVGSKVKAYIKSQDKMCSGELLEALNEKVYCMIDQAICRTAANNRSTVKAQDV